MYTSNIGLYMTIETLSCVTTEHKLLAGKYRTREGGKHKKVNCTMSYIMPSLRAKRKPLIK